jgi:hypothetical protein
MQDLHHLRVKLGIPALQIVLDLVRAHLAGAENFRNGSAPEPSQTRVTNCRTLRPNVLGQQIGGPEFLSVAQILRF